MKKLILALVLFMPGTAWGMFYSGNEMMEVCDKTKSGEAKANVSKYNECVFYLAGVTDYIWLPVQNQKTHHCIPDGIMLEQVRLVFLKYMNANPHLWQFHSAALVSNALFEAWPCD